MKRVFILLVLSIFFALTSTTAPLVSAAGPQTPSCGNYKVTTNEVIVGVKFPKGSYQINAFGISCTKVMGSKGLFAKFLKLKDKDPLPKPWRYLEEAVGAPKFSSGPGVGFRVQLITPTPTPTPTSTPTPTPSRSSSPTQETNLPKVGDKCDQRGSTRTLSTFVLRCVPVINNLFEWVDYTPNQSNLADKNPSSNFTHCRIPDARLQKVQSQSIAYPVVPSNPNFTSTSTITIAIVPIDFPDLQGTYDPKIFMNQIQEETDQWNNWFTRGKSKINWVIYPDWIRANKESIEFNWIHPQSNTSQVLDNSISVGQDLIALTESKIDLKNIQDLLFIYPKNVSKIQDSINYSRVMNTKNGGQFLGMFATSVWSYRDQESLAMWLIHENMHVFGFAGHSPAWPPIFSIAHNQAGLSRVMNVWDRMVLDWLNPGDIYCTDVESLHGESIMLVPEEREQSGPQGIMIKLSSHELLVVESHKRDEWSQSYPADFYGITLMYVDTTRDTDRSGENFGDDGKGTRFARTATYVDLHSLNHAPASNGSISDSVNYMLYQGESFDFKGVRVEFIKTGFNDIVRISKSG